MNWLEIDDRREMTALRATVSLVLGYVLLYSPPLERSGSLICLAAVALHLVSCAAMLKVRRELLHNTAFLGGVLLLDLALITWVMAQAGNADTDFYLVFFLVILMSGMQRDVRLSFVIGGVASLLYAVMWGQSHGGEAFTDPSMALRFPFFFILSFFAAAFVRRVQDRESALKRARRRALEAERLGGIGRLAGGIAVELSAFIGEVRADAERRVKSYASADGVKILELCAAAEAVLAELADAGGRRTPDAPRLNLKHLLEDEQQGLGAAAGSNVTLRLDVSESLPAVQVDRARLRRLLGALAREAGSAVKGLGNVSIAASAVPRKEVPTKLSPDESEQYVRIRLSHGGTALTDEEVRRHFEPFAEGRSAKNGLALASAYGIVRGAGGDVCVTSVPGRGVEYAVFLPAAAAQAPAECRPF
jgi:signal transduction histidine kinase